MNGCRDSFRPLVATNCPVCGGLLRHNWAAARSDAHCGGRPAATRPPGPLGTLVSCPWNSLPAVDVADGQAVRLVQGEAGTETGYGDPLDAALAWQRDGAEWIHLVDLDAAFGRGSNAELLAGVVGAAGRATSSCPAASATTPRWPRPGDRLRPGQHRHRRAGAPAVVRAGDRRARRPGRRRARRARHARWPRAAGPRTAATCGRRWRGSTARAAPATSSPTSAETAR